MMCRLRAHISAITMIAGKSGQRRFWYKKKTQFLSHFNPKIPHQHPYNTQNHYVNSKYLKKIAQEPEIKPGKFWLSRFKSSFLCNIETPNNHHKTPLISKNS